MRWTQSVWTDLSASWLVYLAVGLVVNLMDAPSANSQGCNGGSAGQFYAPPQQFMQPPQYSYQPQYAQPQFGFQPQSGFFNAQSYYRGPFREMSFGVQTQCPGGVCFPPVSNGYFGRFR